MIIHDIFLFDIRDVPDNLESGYPAGYPAKPDNPAPAGFEKLSGRICRIIEKYIIPKKLFLNCHNSRTTKAMERLEYSLKKVLKRRI